MRDPGPEGCVVQVRQGETTEQLAASYRHFWKTVWTHPRNADLRARRKKPNVLREGDELFIPPRRQRDESCATTREHVFRVRGIPSKLTVRCLDLLGRPRAGEPYSVTGPGLDVCGTVDRDGWVRVSISPELTHATLVVGVPESTSCETWELRLGHLDPVEYLSGVCNRLHNLGYYQGPPIDEADQALRLAIEAFRRDHDLADTDELDDAFREALVREHGD